MRLLWNFVLALFWTSLWGDLSLKTLFSGFFIGYLVIYTLEKTELIQNKFYGRKIARACSFFVFFFKELVISNIQVAIDVLRPHPKFSPGIVKIPLDLKDNGQITFLANVITLTPGTLTLDVADDRSCLYVHAMFFDLKNKQAFIDGIKNGFEKRIKELFET